MSRRTLALLAGLCLSRLVSAGGHCARDTALRSGRDICPLPIDDASPADILGSSPLRPLKCLRSGDGPEGVHCIYSAPAFRDGLGIATRASHAANLVGMGSLDDVVTPHAPLHSFSSGPVETADGPPYEVRELPGKGKGVVAKRVIRKGEVFMIDYPAILIERELMAGMNMPSRRGILRGAVGGLREVARERILGLARSSGGDELLDLFVTNGCGIEGFGVAYTGLFPEAARMNHDCQPNAYFRFSARTMTMEVLAYRDILPGEEVTINYAFLGMPYEERQKHLQQTWSFTCSCPLCTSSPSHRSASDARRHDIVHLRKELSKAKAEERYEEVVKAAEGAVGLCEVEGLEALMPEFWGVMAEGYLGMGRLEEARLWAGKALEGRRVFNGEDGTAAAEAEELVCVIEREMRRRRQE